MITKISTKSIKNPAFILFRKFGKNGHEPTGPLLKAQHCHIIKLHHITSVFFMNTTARQSFASNQPLVGSLLV